MRKHQNITSARQYRLQKQREQRRTRLGCEKLSNASHRHPNQLEMKEYFIYLAPYVSLFIDCDSWLDPGDFERFFVL